MGCLTQRAKRIAQRAKRVTLHASFGRVKEEKITF